jgi:dienelactone hydrolase
MQRRVEQVRSRVLRYFGRPCFVIAAALALPSATMLPAAGGETTNQPITILSTATVGGWEVMAIRDSGTDACVARRNLDGSGIDRPHAITFLRTRSLGWLRVSADAWSLTPDLALPVSIATNERVRGAISAAVSAHAIDINLGDLMTTLRRIGDAPMLTIRIAGRTLMLPLAGLAQMRDALGHCVTKRLGAQYAGAVAAPPAALPDVDVREERTFLTVRIGSDDYRLEALVVRPVAAAGRLPIALFAHGQGTSEANARLSTAQFLPQARDLAHRGYLAVVVMWRGFGQSDGIPGLAFGASFSTCERMAQSLFKTAADELAATLTALAERPDADPGRAIVIGLSAGGSAALALAARRIPGLRAVIAISGGLRCSRVDDPQHRSMQSPASWLTPMLASFGARAAVPSLWVYAQEDSFFSEAAARDMHAAYAGATSAAAHFMMIPSIGEDGHAAFAAWRGREQWLPALDRFLRQHGLPTWREDLVDTVIRHGGIDAAYRDEVVAFLSSITPRVLVVDRASGTPYRAAVPFGLPGAHFLAMASCQRQGGLDCVPVMENSRLIPMVMADRDDGPLVR